MSEEQSRAERHAARKLATRRPRYQQQRPKVPPFDHRVFADRIPVRRAAEAIPPHLRDRFLGLATAIARGEEPRTADLLALQGSGLFQWDPRSPVRFAVLTELGVDVALALAADQEERNLRAFGFALLFPRQQAEALIAGPCPVCARPLPMTGLFMCGRCLQLVPVAFRRAAGALSYLADDAFLDRGWATLDAPPRPRPTPSRDQRTAELACIVAARLRLAE